MTFLIVQQYYVWIGLRICCGMQYVSFTVSKPRSMRLCPSESIDMWSRTIGWYPLHCVNLITALRAIHHSFSIHWWSLQFVFCVDDGSCPFSVVCFCYCGDGYCRGSFLLLTGTTWNQVVFFSLHGFCPCVVSNIASTGILVGCLTGFTVQLLPRRRLGGCRVFHILIGDVLLAPTFHWSCILLACSGNYSLTLGYLIPALRV